MRTLFLVTAAIVLLCLSAASAFAGAVYTTEAAFLSQILPGYYLEDFNGWGYGNPLNQQPNWNSPGTVNYGWSAHADHGLYSIGDGYGPVPGALSNWNGSDHVLISFANSPKPVTAVGGWFFGNDNWGNPIASEMKVKLTDGTEVTFVTPGFRGFTSDVSIASLDFWCPLGMEADPGLYPGVDHLYTGAVPEPSSIIALLGGLGSLLAFRRRRA